MPPVFKGKKLPFHQVYEPRAIGFPESMQATRYFKEKKVILVWTLWNAVKKTINYYFLQPGNKTFTKYKCPNSQCIVTFRRKNLPKVDAVLFHLTDTDTEDLPPVRYPHQAWILYNMEPPWLVKKQAVSRLHNLNNLFNWTMSYRNNSDVVAKYGFTMPSNPFAKNKTFDGVMKEKSKNVVWFASDCTTDSRREDYVMEMKKYIDIDVYGKCGNHKCYPSQSNTCYEEVFKNYKFYLSFENAICKDYVTEKFFNVFNYDIIPVVLGALDYSIFAPEGSFINAAHYPKPQVLAEALLKISINETVYIDFLKRKALFKAYLDPWMCRLCDKLHSVNNSSVVRDVKEWFFENADCKRWNSTFQNFLNTNPLQD
ncbi:glycoprotein 3-alpha-L-fucosyltransferase A [Trichonephila clavata]|uniref:Fucosyltransferase n=1 Tax=Trichonephila clavata TaxID=2740835 RepID=A0A8X6HTR2_TRICU|nr:glycoprotein 3-alpha-L-fucosyltransferase A [Trichonephila clavata]